MSHYDRIFLAEPEDEDADRLSEMSESELRLTIANLCVSLEDPNAGGPPGWRKRAQEAIRQAEKRLEWIESVATADEDEDDGK